MLHRTAVRHADRHPDAAGASSARRRRRRALAVCAVAALLLHAALLDGIGSGAPGVSGEPPPAPMSVRTLPQPVADGAPQPVFDSAPQPLPDSGPRRATAAPDSARPPAATAAAATAPAQRPRGPVAPAPAVTSLPAKASADFAVSPALPALSEASAGGGGGIRSTGHAAAVDPLAATTSPTLLGAGEIPPPRYQTQLPPAATLHYRVRRGDLRGTGEVRWQPGAGGYRLVLEARFSGLTLLIQSSEGALDADGLAPVRFLDQRARRAAQAANFRRDEGRVTFSGTGAEWPLLAGSQDRLSWMIQLAAIAAADPGLLVEGGRIAMVVVGARGDAAVWTLRYVGREAIGTVSGTLDAVKLVRDGRSPYDTGAEVWLDPQRSYLPVRTVLRNGAGMSEFELLLERIEPAP